MPASYTPRAPRAIGVRASGVARRRVSTLEAPQGKGGQKGDGPSSPGFLSDHRRAASARDHGGEAEFAASDSYRGRHDDHAWCRKFESALHQRLENRAAMRDCGPRNGETRTRTGDTTIFSRYVLAAASGEIPGEDVVFEDPARRVAVRSLRSFPRVSGDGGGSSPLWRVCSRIQTTTSSWATSSAAMRSTLRGS